MYIYVNVSKLKMAAHVFRSICIATRKKQVIHSQYSIIINPLWQLKIQMANNHNQSNRNNESTRKRFLTYKLAIVTGTLSVAIGYTLFKWKNDISNKFLNYVIPNIPTVSAKSIKTNIDENRNKYNFIADVVEITAPSVVYIEVKDQKRLDFFTGKSVTIRNGSGFIVNSDGLILTNAHVVSNKPNTLVKVNVRLHDGSSYTGRVEVVDLKSDLATVRIDKNDLPAMKLGSSASIRPGEFVVAIGSPLALSNTIITGVVSSANRTSEELGLYDKHMEYIQMDAAITFGNSGGPLVNLNGEAIGVNAMKATDGISFAIPIDYAKNFLKKAEEHRKNKGIAGIKNIEEHPKRRYLGITMLTLTPEILSELRHLNDTFRSNITHGVLVCKVNVHSPAYTGGLMAGDIITHVNNQLTKEVTNIYEILEKSGPLIMTVFRDGEILKFSIDPEQV